VYDLPGPAEPNRGGFPAVRPRVSPGVRGGAAGVPHVPQSLRVCAVRRGRSEPQGLRSLRGRGLLQQQVPNRSLERRAQEKVRFAKQEQLKPSKGGSSRCLVPAHALRGLALLHAPSFRNPNGLSVPIPL
jgi:hypothetical protein